MLHRFAKRTIILMHTPSIISAQQFIRDLGSLYIHAAAAAAACAFGVGPIGFQAHTQPQPHGCIIILIVTYAQAGQGTSSVASSRAGLAPTPTTPWRRAAAS